MNRLFAIIFIILLCAISVNAQTIKTDDGLTVTLNKPKSSCIVYDVTPDTNGSVIIPSELTCDGQKFVVANIFLTNADAHQDLKTLIIEDTPKVERDMTIGAWTLGKNINIELVQLPRDVSSIKNDTFARLTDLKDVVINREEILMINKDDFSDANPSDFLKNTTLHVPAASLNQYKANAESAANDDLKYTLRYWQSCKEIIAIQEEPDPEPEPEPEPAKPEGVKLTTPMAHFLLANAVPGHKIHVIPEEGHEIESVMWQGQDGSEFMDENNVFTVPDYTGEGNINVVMAKAGGISEIESVEADASLRVSAAGGIVKISGAQFGQAATITDLSGHVIYSGESREIALPEGVYLLSIAGRTFKFRI